MKEVRETKENFANESERIKYFEKANVVNRMKQTKERDVSIGFGTWKSLVTFLRQMDRWRQQPGEGG